MRNPVRGVIARSILCLGSIAAMSLIAAGPAPAAPPQDIVIDGSDVYPESMSAAPDGTIYVGSMRGTVFRVAPGGAKAEPWIQPTEKNGILGILGVLADTGSNTLWLCSAPMHMIAPAKPGVSSLMAFDLRSGEQKGAYPFPEPASVCNDITIAKDGTVYVSDTPNGRILTLAPGAKSLVLFAQDPALKGIDGIVFDADGTLYANNVIQNQLLRIDRTPQGAFAAVALLKTSQPVGAPDGFRLIAAHRFLLAEGSKGEIDDVTISGDTATIKVLKNGLVSPPGVTLIGSTAYALEGKIVYLIDPKLKGQDPGPFKIYAVPLGAAP